MRKNFLKITAFTFLILIFYLLKLAESIASLGEPKIIVSNPTPQATGVEYRFQFITNLPLTSNQRISIVFTNTYASPVATSGNVVCPSNMTASVSARTVICQVRAGETHPATTTEIIVRNVTNPVKINPPGIADGHPFVIETDAGEDALLTVLINEGLNVRTILEPFLNFEIQGVEAGQTVHGTSTFASTTPESVFFGENIPVNTPILIAQDLFVKTNAANGFLVNIYQNDELKSEVDGKINKIYCFTNGTCRHYTQAREWVMPDGILGHPRTYGHFGITSEDNSLGANCNQNYYGFGSMPKWAGLYVGIPAEVMRNCGPADGQTQHQGWTRVGFQLEITVLQPNGEYQTNFTYVVVPIF